MSSTFTTGSVTTLSGYNEDTYNSQFAEGGIVAHYALASDSSTASGTIAIPAPSLTLDLTPFVSGQIVPGSLRFQLGSYRYSDRNGTLYHSIDRATGAGIAAGTINYDTGVASISNWPTGAYSFTLLAGLISPTTKGMGDVCGYTASAPLKAQSFSISATTLDGTQLTATANADGSISTSSIQGFIDVQTGAYAMRFGAMDASGNWVTKMVDPSTMKSNSVSYSYMPLDASLIGLNPVRLPQDGRVPFVRQGSFLVLGNTGKLNNVTASNGLTVDCGRVRLSRVRVIGHDGIVINTGYTADLEAGTVSFTDVSTYVQPVTVEHRVEDLLLVSDAQINGLVTFTRPVTHAYPAASSIASTACMLGDLQATISVFFDQATWSGAWADALSGSAATATFDDSNSPIELTNLGTVTERWAIVFANSTTSFNVIGEHVGQIATGNTASDCAPINPRTGKPYFTIRATGWGSGWAAGNVLRFNTVAAASSLWLVRTVQQGPESVINDSFTVLIRGDVDRT